MNRSPADRTARFTVLAFALVLLAATSSDAALQLTRVVNDVKVQPSGQRGRRAPLRQPLPIEASIVTGAKSRAELAFDATSVMRLGAQTSVRPAADGSSVQLDSGALLFSAEKGARSPRITTGGIHVVTSGSTGIIDREGNVYAKILVLAGTARVYLDRLGESVLVRAGQMLITRPAAKTLPEPVNFDIEQLVRTCVLTASDFPPLPSAPAIQNAIAEQTRDPDFTKTNLVIFGRGTLVNLVEPTPSPAAARVPPKP